jgi:hypothetical protein
MMGVGRAGRACGTGGAQGAVGGLCSCHSRRDQTLAIWLISNAICYGAWRAQPSNGRVLRPQPRMSISARTFDAEPLLPAEPKEEAGAV